MNDVVKAGLALVGGVTVVSALVILTGLHHNPMVGGPVSLVFFVGLTIAAVVWLLRRTATENPYTGQLIQGVLLGALAGVGVFVTSWLLMTVVFPEAIDETVQAHIDLVAQSGLPQEQMDAQIASLEETTATSQAMAGMVGTIVTSVIVTAIAAIFLRRK